jgi:hypothetical protein
MALWPGSLQEKYFDVDRNSLDTLFYGDNYKGEKLLFMNRILCLRGSA